MKRELVYRSITGPFGDVPPEPHLHWIHLDPSRNKSIKPNQVQNQRVNQYESWNRCYGQDGKLPIVIFVLHFSIPVTVVMENSIHNTATVEEKLGSLNWFRYWNRTM